MFDVVISTASSIRPSRSFVNEAVDANTFSCTTTDTAARPVEPYLSTASTTSTMFPTATESNVFGGVGSTNEVVELCVPNSVSGSSVIVRFSICRSTSSALFPQTYEYPYRRGSASLASTRTPSPLGSCLKLSASSTVHRVEVAYPHATLTKQGLSLRAVSVVVATMLPSEGGTRVRITIISTVSATTPVKQLRTSLIAGGASHSYHTRRLNE